MAKKLIVCSFYSPPGSKYKDALIDYIVGTLHMLSTKFDDNCGVILGGDRNNLNIASILDTALDLKQIVNLPTRENKILDICITNLHNCYAVPVVVPPVSVDDDSIGVPTITLCRSA